MSRTRKTLDRCKCGKVIFRSVLEAKLALMHNGKNARREEHRYYTCGYKKIHLTSR